MRQAHQHEVEVARLRPLAVHHVEAVAAGRGLADLQHTVIELDVGVHFRAQALDQLLVAVLDGIEADIAVDIHHEVFQRIETVGVVCLGRDVGARHHLEEALGGGIGDFLVEHLFAGLPGPGMLVVVRADALVIFQRAHHIGTALAERFDRGRGLLAVFAAHAGHVVEQDAVELHLLGIHRYRLQPEMLDQLAQRIGAGHRVIVDLGNARFICRRHGIELAGDDLAAQAVGRLEEGDPALVAELLLQIPGAHQPAGAAADNRKIQHVPFRRFRRPLPGKRAVYIRSSKSAFHPERKMNKAGSCTAAMKKNKKAGAWPAFSQLVIPYFYRGVYSAGGNARGSASGAVGTIAACFSRSSRISLSRFMATSRILAIEAPVPAGIKRPTMTFSLRPSSGSTLPLTAASVRTRVVSWNEAAEKKERVCRLALVMPSRTGVPVAGFLPSSLAFSLIWSNSILSTCSPAIMSVSPWSVISTFCSI